MTDDDWKALIKIICKFDSQVKKTVLGKTELKASMKSLKRKGCCGGCNGEVSRAYLVWSHEWCEERDRVRLTRVHFLSPVSQQVWQVSPREHWTRLRKVYFIPQMF
jgi:hypothetical protein